MQEERHNQKVRKNDSHQNNATRYIRSKGLRDTAQVEEEAHIQNMRTDLIAIRTTPQVTVAASQLQQVTM